MPRLLEIKTEATKAEPITIHTTQQEYLRVKVVAKFVPLSIPTIWRNSKLGTFPAPIKLSQGVTAWKTSDVRAWLDSRAAV